MLPVDSVGQPREDHSHGTDPKISPRDKSVLTILHDTFVQKLQEIINTHSLAKPAQPVSLPYLFGRTGHGARFSLAMNTKTGKEIGHPSAHYSFDIIGVVDHCFPDAGIDATLYVGPGYVTRARSTAAQADREVAENVVVFDNYVPDIDIEGHLLYADHTGIWKTAASSDELVSDWDQMPFGPVVLDIHNFTPQQGFPSSTFRYLVDTLERGEEPMEIAGRGKYSTVSGWKAFARWMQAFNIPLPGVQHKDLPNYAELLIERRSYFVQFLNDLHYQLKDTPMIDHFKHSISLDDVRTCYFAEQKTLTYYKKIDTYLTHDLDMP